MADRKRKVEQAIQESVEMSNAPAPAESSAKQTNPTPQEAKGIAARIKRTKVARTREMLKSAADAKETRRRGSTNVVREELRAREEASGELDRPSKGPYLTRPSKAHRAEATAKSKAEYDALPEPGPLTASSQFQRSQLKPRKRG